MAPSTYNTKFANIDLQHVAAVQNDYDINVSVLKNSAKIVEFLTIVMGESNV